MNSVVGPEALFTSKPSSAERGCAVSCGCAVICGSTLELCGPLNVVCERHNHHSLSVNVLPLSGEGEGHLRTRGYRGRGTLADNPQPLQCSRRRAWSNSAHPIAPPTNEAVSAGILRAVLRTFTTPRNQGNGRCDQQPHLRIACPVGEQVQRHPECQENTHLFPCGHHRDLSGCPAPHG